MKTQLNFVVAFVGFALFLVASCDKATACDCGSMPNPTPCDSCLSCQPDTLGSYLYDKSIFSSGLFENQLIGRKSQSKIFFYGWALTGITVNNHGVTNEYGSGFGTTSAYGYNQRGDGSGITDLSGNSYVLMAEQPSNWKLNQLWVGAKKELDDQFGLGFQADFGYGTDARYATNWGDHSFDYDWGSGDYFAAMIQLYATIGTKDLFVKVGKFGGGLPYEGMAAPGEFFYSHAHIAYGRPMVVNGAMLEWHPNKKWMLSGGWTTGMFNGFENPHDDHAFLGKVTRHLTKKVSLSYRLFYNDKGARSASQANPLPNTGSTDCFHSLFWTWKITDRLFFMNEYGYSDSNIYRTAGKSTGDSWGVNNHLIYTVNEKFAVGVRGEYHYSRSMMFDHPAITYTAPGNGGQGGDLWEVTLAAPYKISPKTTVRPEIRYDYAVYNNGFRPFGGSSNNDHRKNDQICGGVSFIVML